MSEKRKCPGCGEYEVEYRRRYCAKCAADPDSRTYSAKGKKQESHREVFMDTEKGSDPLTGGLL